ncbi:MAG: hypothetical protein KatS3mg027_1264 [Bacteroidia bacterium]|nr:MAG: hypothetical protein KatS3mg027_1264 [Bacteroidia bacterium]
MNSGTGAIMFGKTYAPIGLSSILPEGGLFRLTKDISLCYTDQQVTGFNYNVVRTDNNGDIGLSAQDVQILLLVPALSLTTSLFNPLPLHFLCTCYRIFICTNCFQPYSHYNVHCLNCNISVVPTLTATPNPICAGQNATICRN